MDRAASAPASHAPMEIELKFALPPAELRRLLRHPLLARARARRRMFASTYFDTPELALHERLLSLRIRRNGKGYMQTLKAGGADGAPVAREEWQAPLPRAVPDLSQPELRARLGDIEPERLRPVFVSRVRRSTRLLHPDEGTTIELSCDRGEIETPAGKSLPVSELELELKQGEAAALFALARNLNRSLPLHVERTSKAARGYALLNREDADAARRRTKLLLAPETPVEASFAGLVEHCLDHVLANDRAALAGDAEGVHQMRVALRRLRSIFKLFKAVIPEEERRYAIGEMKWIAASLGPARNWDVFAGHLAEVTAGLPGDAALELLAAATEAKRQAAREAARAAIASTRYTDFALAMLEAIERRRGGRNGAAEPATLLTAAIDELAPALLDRRYRKARKLAQKFERLTAEQRHKLRIALKELRYAEDVLAGLFAGKPLKRQRRRLAALQDELGLLNDVATMERLFAELAPPESDALLQQGAAVMRGWYGRVAAERQKKLGKRVARFLKAKRFWTIPAAS